MGPRGIWMREVWGLVLSLCSYWGFQVDKAWIWGFLRGIVSRFPSGGGLEPGHGSVSAPVTSWATLIHRRGLEASLCLNINCFFNQCVPTVELPLALFHLGLNQGLESFSKESNEVGLFWSGVNIKIDNRNAWGETPNCELPLASTWSLI